MRMCTAIWGTVKRSKMANKWIQKALAKHKPGTLHKQLGVAMDKKIPVAKLKEAAKEKGKLGQRARLALTLKKISKKR